MKKVLANCLPCAKRKAQVAWIAPTVIPRHPEKPVFSEVAIDHLHLAKKKVLSVLCINTMFLALIHVESLAPE